MMYKYYPPQAPDVETISVFSDSLRSIVPEKIQECLAYLQNLKEERKDKLKAINHLVRRQEIDNFTEYFYVLLTEIEFQEAAVTQKWILYWLNIFSRLEPERKWKQNTTSQKLDEYQIKQAQQYPIENLYEGNLRTSGSRLSGLCPFHNEKTPSFVIFTNNNTYYCFGCATHGDVIDFYMKKKNATFIEAIKDLQI